MDDCSVMLRDIFSKLSVEKPEIPFYSSLLGGRAERLDAHHFLRVGRDPIHFSDALKDMVGSSITSYDFIDLGPFGSLTDVIKQSLAVEEDGVQCYPLLSTFADSRQLFTQLVEEKAIKA